MIELFQRKLNYRNGCCHSAHPFPSLTVSKNPSSNLPNELLEKIILNA
jgi:hypothetical protein